MQNRIEGRRSRDDLELRLSRRRIIESLHHKGRRAHGRGDFLLRHHRTMARILRAGLQLAGLYQRGVENARTPVIRALPFEFPNVPAAFDGFRILLLADLHIDGVDGLAEALAERLVRLPVDLCVMTGDYRFEVDGSCGAIYPRMRTILSSVESRHGVAAILGNHDPSEIAGELENLGVGMLINEALELRQGPDSLWVIGIDDPHYYGCDDLTAALQATPPGDFKILLSHTPEIFEEACAAGVHLCLCGHTHGGQICLPWMGPALLNASCPRAYAHGRWQHGGTVGYTSAGVGCSMLPVRYNCPPEIAVIELIRKVSLS